MSTRHGEASWRNHPGTAEYRAWAGMKSRCYQPSHNRYAVYGGRGIRMCARWLGKEGYQNFLADMGRRPSDLHSIDRIDNDLHYSPDNCKWSTSSDQARNRSTSKLTREQVDIIIAMRQVGITRARVAALHGVTPQMITRITSGKAWVQP